MPKQPPLPDSLTAASISSVTASPPAAENLSNDTCRPASSPLKHDLLDSHRQAPAPEHNAPCLDDLIALQRSYRDLEAKYEQTRHRLELADARSHSFLRLSPDAIVIARRSDGCIIDVNPRFVELSGYSKAEAVGKTPLELGLWKDPDARRRLRETLATEGSVQNFETRFVLKSGQEVHALISAASLPPASTDRMMVVVRDIDPIHTTATIIRGHREALQLQNDWLQRVQQDLSTSRQQYQDLFESAPVGYCTLNRDGVILAVNRTGAEMLMQTRDALCGVPLVRLVADGYQQVVQEHLERVFERLETVTCEVRLKASAGRGRFFRLISSALGDSDGRLRFCRTAFLDDTDKRRAQTSLGIANRFLSIANRGEDVDYTLQAFLDEMKRSTGCQALGIRMRIGDNTLPLTISVGFPESFHQIERQICGRTKACICDKVASLETDPHQPFFTANGTFYAPNLSRMIPNIVQTGNFESDSVCAQMGFETLAIIPIRAGDTALGLVMVADKTPEVMDRQAVRLLENAALQLGNSLRRVRVEEALRRSHDELEERVNARTAEVVEANRQLQEQIAGRERAEKHLRQSQEMLQQVFDGISDPLVLTDGQMRIQMVNRAAKTYYELESTEAMIGLQCNRFLPKDKEACVSCPIPDAVANAHPIDFERQGFKEAARTEKVVIYPLADEDGSHRGAVIRIQDITEEKAMERQLIQSEKLASLGMLVSSVAHEINNPNSFISFNIPILREYLDALMPIVDDYISSHADAKFMGMPYSEFRPDLLRMIDNIEHGSQRINTFLANLREFSAARPTLHIRPLVLQTVVDKALALVSPKVRKTIKTLDVDIAPGLPKVYTDESALEQILVNLLVNAAQAADKPDAWIHLAARQCGDKADVIELTVADNGCGMSEAVQEKIFEPFFSTKINEGGTGLGLYVCRKLIRQLGGRLLVESTLGQGSRFMLRLPCGEGGVVI